MVFSLIILVNNIAISVSADTTLARAQQTVPPNTQLTVRIGFLSGATGTDGAEFDVYFDEYRGTNEFPLRKTHHPK